MAVINLHTISTSGVFSGVTRTTSSTTLVPYPAYSSFEPFKTKPDYINEFFYRCESDDRMVLILEKVKDGKLTPNEALDILKGVKHFTIDGVSSDT